MTINGLENVSRAQAALVHGTSRNDSSHAQAGPRSYPSRPGGPQGLLSGIETERENENCGHYHRTQANNVARGFLYRRHQKASVIPNSRNSCSASSTVRRRQSGSRLSGPYQA